MPRECLPREYRRRAFQMKEPENCELGPSNPLKARTVSPPLTVNFTKPLAIKPDAADLELHAANARPELVTRRLRELVPLLDVLDCRVVRITDELTELRMPLLVSAMNQNGTHQASVFYLAADYALGIAMFGALPGVYVSGVHDRCEALPVQ